MPQVNVKIYEKEQTAENPGEECVYESGWHELTQEQQDRLQKALDEIMAEGA